MLRLKARAFLDLPVATAVTYVSRTAFGWWLSPATTGHLQGARHRANGVKLSAQKLFCDIRISSVLQRRTLTIFPQGTLRYRGGVAATFRVRCCPLLIGPAFHLGQPWFFYTGSLNVPTLTPATGCFPLCAPGMLGFHTHRTLPAGTI